jgi:hypothetical protein
MVLAQAAAVVVHVAKHIVAARPAYDFGGGESAQRLGGMVPVQDATVGIDEIDGIVQVVQEQFVKVSVVGQESLHGDGLCLQGEILHGCSNKFV